MNRRTSPRSGPPTTPAPPMETTDAESAKNRLASAAPLLARPPRVVRRCCLRKLSSFAGQAVGLPLHSYTGGVLRGATQSPLLPAQPLLLKLFSWRGVPIPNAKFRSGTLESTRTRE